MSFYEHIDMLAEGGMLRRLGPVFARFVTSLAAPDSAAAGTPLALACLLNQPIKGRAVFRTIFYLPAVTAGVATAYLWAYLFSNNGGIVNTVLGLFGIEGPNWLYSTEWSLPTLIILSCWNVGTSMLIYLAALQAVPEGLHEAAMIDGAGTLRRFWNVTVPMITPAIADTL